MPITDKPRKVHLIVPYMPTSYGIKSENAQDINNNKIQIFFSKEAILSKFSLTHAPIINNQIYGKNV